MVVHVVGTPCFSVHSGTSTSSALRAYSSANQDAKLRAHCGDTTSMPFRLRLRLSLSPVSSKSSFGAIERAILHIYGRSGSELKKELETLDFSVSWLAEKHSCVFTSDPDEAADLSEKDDPLLQSTGLSGLFSGLEARAIDTPNLQQARKGQLISKAVHSIATSGSSQ